MYTFILLRARLNGWDRTICYFPIIFFFHLIFWVRFVSLWNCGSSFNVVKLRIHFKIENNGSSKTVWRFSSLDDLCQLSIQHMLRNICRTKTCRDVSSTEMPSWTVSSLSQCTDKHVHTLMYRASTQSLRVKLSCSKSTCSARVGIKGIPITQNCTVPWKPSLFLLLIEQLKFLHDWRLRKHLTSFYFVTFTQDKADTIQNQNLFDMQHVKSKVFLQKTFVRWRQTFLWWGEEEETLMNILRKNFIWGERGIFFYVCGMDEKIL